MFLSKLILLFFIFQIERSGATEIETLVIDNNTEVKTENLLIEFMTDLKKFNFEKLIHHRLIVLGKNDHFLQTTKVLLESGMPYFITTKPDPTILPLDFGGDSIVLFFIDGLSDSEMNSAFAKLPNNYKCKVLLISVEKNETEELIAKIISSAVKMHLENVLFARFDGRLIKIYGNFLNAECQHVIKLVNAWVPEKGFNNTESVLGRNEMLNAQGCPLIVSTFESPPVMMLQKDEAKMLQIRGGIEGHLVQYIAEYLNTVPVVKPPSAEEQFKIVEDVVNGVANLGIGQITPTPMRANLVDFSSAYNYECVVWTVPLRRKYMYSVLISEFSSTTWIIVIISVLLWCGLMYIIPKLNLGHRTSLNIFDVIAMTLNYAIPRNPSGLLCKLLFLLYLNYSRVISTAYLTSLSSIVTTESPDSSIVDEDGIIASGLRTAGSQSSRDMLADQLSANNTRFELLDRYELIMSHDAALARIADDEDIAYIRHSSTINFAKKQLLYAGKSVKFYSLPDCVISYHPVMVVPKGSSLIDRINYIILRLHEAGLPHHWAGLDQKSPVRNEILEYNDHMLSRLESVFFLYLCCLIPAFLAFGAELILFKLKPDWLRR